MQGVIDERGNDMKKMLCLLMSLLMLLSLIACGDNTATQTSGTDAETEKDSTSAVETAKTAETSASGEKTKLTILRPGDEKKVRAFLEPVVEEFMKENPDIEVTIQYESWGGWISKYPTVFQAGTQPDVIFWWDKALCDMYAKGKILPIEEYIDPSILEEIPQNILDTCKIDGTLYHVPVDMYGFVMYYRKDIFEQAGLDPNSPPKTWEELLEAAKQIKEKTGINPIGLPGKAGLESCHEMVAEFITQATGEPLLDENNQITFNNDKGLEALNYLNELMKYADPNVTDYGRGDVRQLLKDGQIAIELGDSTWAVPEFQAAFGENLDESKLGVAGAPTGPAGKYNWCGLDGWAIAQEATAEASGRLITYLCSPEVSFQHHSVYGGMPYTNYELEQPAFHYDFWNVFKAAVSDYTLIQRIGKYHPAPSAFYTELEPIWQEMLMGSIDSETAIEEAVTAIDDINSRYGIQ